MTQEALELTVLFSIAICAWWIFFVEQQSYWLDLTRQRLFAIRNELFDCAIQGKISFDHPAYKMTRTTLNGMIRFTHEVNLLYFLTIYFAHRFVFKRRRATDYERRFSSAIQTLPLEGRAFIYRTIGEAHMTVLRHVMSTSPFLWPILKPLSIVSAALHKTNKLRKWALRGKNRKQPWVVLDAEANYIGGQVRELQQAA